MNGKKKIKVVMAILSSSVLIALIILGIKYFDAKYETYEDDLTSAERDELIVTESYPTQFVVYGDRINLGDAIKVEYIDGINENSLARKTGYQYQCIIINDINQNIQLSDDDWKMLNDLVINDKERNLLYLGNKEFDRIRKLKIASDITIFEEGDKSVGFFYEAGTLITVHGTYVEGDSDSLLSESIIHEQAYSIKMSNQ